MRNMAVTLLVAMLIAIPACSNASLWFEDTFEGYSLNHDINTVSGGWSGYGICTGSTLVDSGQCARMYDTTTPSFSESRAIPLGTLNTGDMFETSFVMKIDQMVQDDAVNVGVIEQAGGILHYVAVVKDAGQIYIGTNVCTSDYSKWIAYDHKSLISTGATRLDVRLDVTPTGTYSYVKFDGGGWLLVSSLEGSHEPGYIAGYTTPMATIMLKMANGGGGVANGVNLDTLRVSTIPASVPPKPVPPDIQAILAQCEASSYRVLFDEEFEETSPPTMFPYYRGTVPNTVNFSGVSTEQAYAGSHSYKTQVSFQAGQDGTIYFILPAEMPVWSDMKLTMYVKVTQAPPNASFFHGFVGADCAVPVNNNTINITKVADMGNGWEKWQGTLQAVPNSVSSYIQGAAVRYQLPGSNPATTVTVYVDKIILEGKLQDNWQSIWTNVHDYYISSADDRARALGQRRLADMQQWYTDISAGLASLQSPQGAPAIITSQYNAIVSEISSALSSALPMMNGIASDLNDYLRPFTSNVNAPERILSLAKRNLDIASGYYSYANAYPSADLMTFVLDPTQSYPILPTGPTAQIEEVTYYDNSLPGLENPQILPDTNPVPAKPSRQLQGFGCRGTFVPLSFAVRAGVDLQSLALVAGNLVGPGGATINASSVDIRVVAPWYRPYNGSARLMNEMLVHDPGFVVPDSSQSINHFGWTDVNNADDSTSLLPLTISAGRNRQFYVTVKIPDNAAAGTYTGQIQASAAGGKNFTFNVSIEVLPFSLDPTPYAYSAFYMSSLEDKWSGVNSWKKSSWQMQEELSNMVDHGLNTLTLYDGNPKQNGSVWDFSDLGTRLALAKQAGLTRSPFVWLGIPLYYKPYPPQTYNDMVALINSLVPAANQYCQTNGYPRPAFYGQDEASGANLASFKPGYDAVNAAGGIVAAACSPGYFADIGTGLSLPILYNGAQLGQRDMSASQSAGYEVWIYNCPTPNRPASPSSFRRRYGLAMWKNGEQGTSSWQYSGVPEVPTGTPYDFGNFSIDCYAFAFPTKSGKPIDSVTYEAYREAVYDSRYTATLEDRLAKVKAVGGNPTLVAEIESWLGSVSVHDDLQSVRRTMANYIEILTGSVKLTVTFLDFPGDKTLQPVRVQAQQNGTPIGSPVTAFLDGQDSIVIDGLPVGDYDLLVSSSKCLDSTVSAVHVAGGLQTTRTVSLANGDVNGDKHVTTTDLSIVLKNVQ